MSIGKALLDVLGEILIRAYRIARNLFLFMTSKRICRACGRVVSKKDYSDHHYNKHELPALRNHFS